VAISLLLVAGASLLVRSFWNLLHQDFGYRQDGVLMVHTRLDFSNFRALRGLDTQPVYERLNAIPGVRSAALAGLGPFSEITGGAKIALAERPPLPSDDIRSVSVSPRYFETMGIPIGAGRPITEGDRSGTVPVAVISQTAARVLFGAVNPIGRFFSTGQVFDQRAAILIVGVAHDIRYANPRDPFGMIVYRPLSQAALPLSSMALRTAGAPALLATSVRRAIEETAPALKIAQIQPLSELLESKAGQERMMALLSGAFGLLALVLASVGLYGVIAYGVEQRRQEIGIRLALGANRAEVTGLLLREVAQVLAIGLALGGAAEVVLGQSVKALLFGLTPHDPAMLMGSAALLSVVALAAGYLPARRAAHLDPMNALRQE
jgi:predicted permease